jgi:arylsulfatase
MDYGLRQVALRVAFFTGMTPLRTGMVPPQLPGSPSYAGVPSAQPSSADLGYNTANLARTIWVTTPTC